MFAHLTETWHNISMFIKQNQFIVEGRDYMTEKKIVSSEIEVTLKVIGGKWKPLILHYLQYEGPKRYNEIFRYLGSAPKKTLTLQLRELEDDGILKRTIIEGNPVGVEYSITPLGETLYPILEAMCSWGYHNMGDKYILTHATCSGSSSGSCSK